MHNCKPDCDWFHDLHDESDHGGETQMATVFQT